MEALNFFNKPDIVLSENSLRMLTGGSKFTNENTQNDDFIDNCGVTSYADCDRGAQGDGLDDSDC